MNLFMDAINDMVKNSKKESKNMKFLTSKKHIRENYYRIISTGYCNLQHLLAYKIPIAYSARKEGWACDYYEVNGILISTGYSPAKEKNTKNNYVLTRRYDLKAHGIVNDPILCYGDKKAMLDDLLSEFVEKMVANFNEEDLKNA